MSRIPAFTLLGAVVGFTLGMLVGLLIIGFAVLYYWFIFGVTLGLIPGAVIGVVVGGGRSWQQVAAPSRLTSHSKRHLYLRQRFIAVITISVCGLIVLPLCLIGRTRLITHAMRWQIVTNQASSCNSTVVLMFVKYAEYETFCSARLQRYLEKRGTPTVPVTFEVTYDFERVRGYHPKTVGDYVVEDELNVWKDAVGGCGGEFLPACDSDIDMQASPWRE